MNKTGNIVSDIKVENLCNVIDLLYTCMDDYLYVYDLVNDFYYISPTAVEKFPLKTNYFHNVIKNLESLVYPPDFPSLQADINNVLTGVKSTHNLQYRWVDRSGHPVWIKCQGNVIRDKVSGKVLYMLGCVNEIGAHQKADNISGLLSLSGLKDLLNSFTGPYPDGFILRLGPDDFKEINEKLGVEYGDFVLFKIAECISKCLLSHQYLYRAGSDEFIVIDLSGTKEQDAIALYKNIRHAIDAFVSENRYNAVFTISAGLLMFESVEEHTYNNILKLSEFALSSAKKLGKNNCYTFENEDYYIFLKKRNLTRLLKQSVDNNFEGFEVYFQPLYTLHTNDIYGAEALMRFKCEEFGLISPIEFIPILEETGLILPAGKWILHEALKTCKKIKEHIPDFKISINVSYIQVIKSDIIDEIIYAVSKYNVKPSDVIIELTESGQMASDAHIRKMWTKLKDHGIMVALDDFGTGYSNFHYLYDLKPDILKIDRSFTVQAMENEYEYNLLNLISDMGHNLQLKICVEGIENDNELARMKILSPDYCQGYYFGKPCSYNDFHSRYIIPDKNAV